MKIKILYLWDFMIYKWFMVFEFRVWVVFVLSYDSFGIYCILSIFKYLYLYWYVIVKGIYGIEWIRLKYIVDRIFSMLFILIVIF